MKYSLLIDELKACSEENFAAFQRKLIDTKQVILGVRTPVLRKLAKKYQNEFAAIFAFPDEYYEVTFIKLTLVSALPYHEFLKYLPKCVLLIDNWATCDCFKAKCIAEHKEDFLPVLRSLFAHGGEFFERYVLVALLADYVEESYLDVIKDYLQKADCSKYYIHMAAAWLTAEVLTKQFAFGVRLLQEKVLEPKTHNKAIQKARESYRITKEQKEFLHSLKIKA